MDPSASMLDKNPRRFFGQTAASDDGGDCGLPHEETLMFRLTEAVGSNVASAQGWQRLETAMRRI